MRDTGPCTPPPRVRRHSLMPITRVALAPQVLKEMRVKGQLVDHKEVRWLRRARAPPAACCCLCWAVSAPAHRMRTCSCTCGCMRGRRWPLYAQAPHTQTHTHKQHTNSKRTTHTHTTRCHATAGPCGGGCEDRGPWAGVCRRGHQPARDRPGRRRGGAQGQRDGGHGGAWRRCVAGHGAAAGRWLPPPCIIS
jgi:hypothetical protein